MGPDCRESRGTLDRLRAQHAAKLAYEGLPQREDPLGVDAWCHYVAFMRKHLDRLRLEQIRKGVARPKMRAVLAAAYPPDESATARRQLKKSFERPPPLRTALRNLEKLNSLRHGCTDEPCPTVDEDIEKEMGELALSAQVPALSPTMPAGYLHLISQQQTAELLIAWLLSGDVDGKIIRASPRTRERLIARIVTGLDYALGSDRSIEALQDALEKHPRCRLDDVFDSDGDGRMIAKKGDRLRVMYETETDA